MRHPFCEGNRKPTAVEPPTVRAIVALYLREHGYDGLAGGDQNCGCYMTNLFPCEGQQTKDCIAAYYRRATLDEVDGGMARYVGDMIFSPKKEG